jgi:small subunit ribosomal protein S6
MTSKYELALAINGSLEDDAKNAALAKVQEYITRFGGTTTNVDDWGKKRFAYEVDKQKEGYYYFITFETENPTCPTEIENHIRLREEIARFLIVKQEA